MLAFACRRMETMEVSLEDENNLLFLGLIAMMDPPSGRSPSRPWQNVLPPASGPVMITGDHVVTASAIAKEIGILTPGTEAVEGAVVEKMSEEELKEFVPKVSVYARVSPEHKIRIVRAWQEKGALVAMTGDGVNDAPCPEAGGHRRGHGHHRHRGGQGRRRHGPHRRQLRHHRPGR